MDLKLKIDRRTIAIVVVGYVLIAHPSAERLLPALSNLMSAPASR